MKTWFIRPLVVVVALQRATLTLAAPPSIAPSGPSPAAVQQVESRRKVLAQFESANLDRLSPNERAAMLGKMGPALTELAAALASDNVHVYTSAVTDLTNGLYRAFPQDPLLGVLLPALKTPQIASQERMVSQSFIMEHLANRFGLKAKAAMPDLLKMVVNDKLPTYLRGQAIDAAAKIAPGDEAATKAVVQAFIAAIENPIPQTESGVHDRAARHLGEMGKPALPAKEALKKLFASGSWRQDPALEALGKICQDEPAKPLADYLARLELLSKTSAEDITVEQAAVAFHHVVVAVKTGKKRLVGSPPREEEVIEAEAAKSTRPVLLAVAERRKDDAYFRAALRALAAIGPGSSPRAAKVLADLLVRTGSSDVVATLDRLDPTDVEAVAPLAEAFAKAAALDQRYWHISYRLAQVLARYGRAAKPAVPSIVTALRDFRASPTAGDAYADQFAMFLSVLTAAGSGDAGAQRVVIELLEPASDVMKRSAPIATSEYHVHLLRTLANLGLPKESGLRSIALARVREGLASDVLPVFGAAANVVVAARPLTDDEATPLVPILVRTLTPKFMFKRVDERLKNRLASSASSDDRLGQVPALRALASLGKAARGALPAVKAIAERPPEVRRSSFLPEPPFNAAIREARKTIEAIE